MSEPKGTVPWGLHPLPKWIETEIRNRGREYDLNPSPTDEKPYSGPRTAWTRVFSNGKSKLKDASDLQGFVLGGPYGFNDSYGFKDNGESGKIAIGVDAYGRNHLVDSMGYEYKGYGAATKKKSDFPHRPPPSVESVECELAGSNSSFPSLCRKIKISWRCYSLAQLNYMIPYFLTPRITCLVEWGWNNYDPISLVDLTDLDWLNNMFIDPKYTTRWVEESSGNYDAGMGFVTDYGYSLNEGGGYNCHTTITNANFLVEGKQLHDNSVSKKKDAKEKTPVKTFIEFLKNDLQNITSDKPEIVSQRVAYGLDTPEKPIANRTFKAEKGKHDSPANNDQLLWLRMDLVTDIINAFFNVEMKTQLAQPSSSKNVYEQEKDLTASIMKLTIDDVKMCGNPLIKSVNKNVLIPNQMSPRFTSTKMSGNSGNSYTDDATYKNLFKETVEKVSSKFSLSSDFDNLQELINPNGNSFPMYISDKQNESTKSLKPGYWGYLKDLYIESKYLVGLASKNDSVLKMVEELLQGITQAMCNIPSLKLIPSEYGNKYYSIIDNNFPGASTPNEATTLTKITLGSVNDSFIRSAQFDVKISPEMMNQLVMQSANPEKDPPGSITEKNTNTNPIVSRYSAGDRLYEKGELPKTQPSQNSPEKPKEIKFTREENRFYIYKKGEKQNTKQYILCEKEKDFMNYLIALPNNNAPYINNGIMPSTTITMEILGISGITYLSQFTLDHVPETYDYEHAVWQISDIKHKIENKFWTTTIVAQVRPLTVV